jgi:hypothetical protein
MAMSYEFEGYIGKDVPLKPGTWTVIPNTRFVPSKSGLLVPNVYINCQYKIADTAKHNGKLWIKMVREKPIDDTMHYHLIAEKGYGSILDSRSFEKWWSESDVAAGRGVHLEAQIKNVTSAYLNDTCYVSYSQKW